MKTTVYLINGTNVDFYESDSLPAHATLMYKIEQGNVNENIIIENKEGQTLIPIRNILFVKSRNDY